MSRYLDDWTVGEQFTTPGRTVCECDVNLFAGLTGDMHQNHTDASYMENSQFGKRIAHGLLILAMPIVLGSWIALAFMIPLPFILVKRIHNEEEVLKAGLDGYAAYMEKVTYRMIPFIW